MKKQQKEKTLACSGFVERSQSSDAAVTDEEKSCRKATGETFIEIIHRAHMHGLLRLASLRCWFGFQVK